MRRHRDWGTAERHARERTSWGGRGGGVLRAQSFYELMHCHEVVDRLDVARVLVEHMLHRKETRWNAYQTRLDYPDRDDARWMCYVNSVRDRWTGEIRIVERAVEGRGA